VGAARVLLHNCAAIKFSKNSCGICGGDVRPRVFTYFGHLPPAYGTLVLVAQHSHSRRTLEAHGVITDAQRVNFHVFTTHHAQIFRLGRVDALFGIRHFVDFKSKEFVKIRKTQPNFVNDSSLVIFCNEGATVHSTWLPGTLLPTHAFCERNVTRLSQNNSNYQSFAKN
jgi:hypothetical protein